MLDGPIPEGRVVSVQVNYDPGWRADQDGQAIAVEQDRLGYIVLRANASPGGRIHLKYRGTAEQYAMAVLSAMVWLGSLVFLAKGR